MTQGAVLFFKPELIIRRGW